MRTLLLSYCLIVLFILGSCNRNETKEASTTAVSQETLLGDSDKNIEEKESIHFNDNWNKLDEDKVKLTKEQFDSLKLYTVDYMKEYDYMEYVVDREIMRNENGNLISVKAISGGEISEFILSYDAKGSMIDHLLVAYEDAVESFSITSSTINENIISVATVNFDYSMDIEASDTIISTYKITPELKFDQFYEEKE